jgi:hypothetical protein
VPEQLPTGGVIYGVRLRSEVVYYELDQVEGFEELGQAEIVWISSFGSRGIRC